MNQYILDGKKVVKELSNAEWGQWYEHANRHVADTLIRVISHADGSDTVKQDEPEEVRVSTVFLGIDHAFSDADPDRPLIFETMIFGGEHNDYQRRCYTWEQAESMHMAACKLVIFGEVGE